MSKTMLCQGLQCPNRGECLYNARYHAATPEQRHAAIKHCIDQKKFERIRLDHPQMRGSYPRGC